MQKSQLYQLAFSIHFTMPIRFTNRISPQIDSKILQ